MSFNQPADNSDTSWITSASPITRIMGFSLIASIFQGLVGKGASMGQGSGSGSSYIMDSVRLFVLGAIIESGRRIFGWVVQRFKPFQFSVTAHFSDGDPAYEWILLFLTEEKIWTRSRQFHVNAASSLRRWSVSLRAGLKPGGHIDEHAEYVPTYDEPQLFRWKGYWAETRRGNANGRSPGMGEFGFSNTKRLSGGLSLTIYTRDMSVLSALVDDARQRYVKSSRPHVIVHTADQPLHYNPYVWGSTKVKTRRPLSSVILQEGIINSLVEDAREFIKSENWYTSAGIPHRRGYLLYGPPGTGKSSTIYAVAGELGLEIFSISLASSFIDDSYLRSAVAAIPKQAIFLIEDIDCAFPSREDTEDDERPIDSMSTNTGIGITKRSSAVTLSGLLNVLDGVGSEEGKIFFATTNYLDRLDPALLRPGRIDMKIIYKLATKAQAAALFLRFYPEGSSITMPEKLECAVDGPQLQELAFLSPSEKQARNIQTLSERFAVSVPQHEFSTAELQGFLLSCKHEPVRAAEEVSAWVEQERRDKIERVRREEELKEKNRTRKEAREAKYLQDGLAKLGVSVGGEHINPVLGAYSVPPPDETDVSKQPTVSDFISASDTMAANTVKDSRPSHHDHDALDLSESPRTSSESNDGSSDSSIVHVDTPSSHGTSPD